MSTQFTSESTMITASNSSSRWMLILLMISISIIAPVSSFAVPPPQTTTTFSQSITASTIQCRMSPPSSSTTPESAALPEESVKETKTKTTPTKNEDIMKQLERAKATIAVSRAKIEAQEAFVKYIKEADDKQNDSNDKEKEIVPFFATANNDNDNSNTSNGKKEKVIKDKNEDTGSFTTDGELMAKLSEQEEWESRPILEVFETEEQEGEKKSFNAKNVDRDIAKSMFNLRKSLQTEDFMKIFDKRNIFIGDP
jgi:hypothetical protein